MVESRWPRRIGPVLATVGAVVVAAATTTGDPGAWLPPPCVGPPGPGPGGIGAWYRLDPVITDGIRTGQRLSVGRGDGDAAAHVDLDAESFASGPFGGTILSGTDDGRTSRLSLLDLGAGCTWAVGRSGHVVRHATLTPDGRSIVEFRVDRRARSDLGVWARPLDGGDASRILGPIDADARFGPTWLTQLGWSQDGRTLVVESCGEVACRFRLLDMASASSVLVADPSVGSLVGVADELVIARGACLGLPCPLLALDQDGGPPVTLADTAGQAVLARDAAGRALLVHEVDADGGVVRAIRPDGRDPHPLPLPADGQRLIGPPSWSGGGAELGAGWIPFGPDGRLPVAGDQPAVLRHVSDGRAVRLDEVPR